MVSNDSFLMFLMLNRTAFSPDTQAIVVRSFSESRRVDMPCLVWSRQPKKARTAFREVSCPFEADPDAWRMSSARRCLAGCRPGVFEELYRGTSWYTDSAGTSMSSEAGMELQDEVSIEEPFIRHVVVSSEMNILRGNSFE